MVFRVVEMVFELADFEADVSTLQPVDAHVRSSPITVDVLQLFIDLYTIQDGLADVGDDLRARYHWS